ncbi:MAG: carboxylating nicotinate-nucleotide diphosphorylase [Planctomycetota bacterium]|nr:MAG: carboxylating nicotinate-nucleotide diphosphorylase [Planctomycetota bacterium]
MVPNTPPPYDHPHVRSLLLQALEEDCATSWDASVLMTQPPRLGHGDVTAACLVEPGGRLHGTVRAKAAGVLCGMPLWEMVLAEVGGDVVVDLLAADGDVVQPNDAILHLSGDAASILIAERTALNCVQQLSGVATATARAVSLVAGYRCRIFDTRKTTPGQRYLEKYAVRCGGGANHRMGLYDQVLIKENHIALMAKDQSQDLPAAQAVARCRQRLGETAIIEVEIQDIETLEPVIAAGADVILLDNMDDAQVAAAVVKRDQLGCAPHACSSSRRPVWLEASGGITDQRLPTLAASGVERISIGGLTHSAPALDLSLVCHP